MGDEEAPLVRGRDGGGAVVHAELRVDVEQMRLHRRLGDEEPSGCAGVRIAVGDEGEHLELPVAQRLVLGSSQLTDEAGRDRGRKHRLAARGGVDRADELLARRVLEQVPVAPASSAGTTSRSVS